MQKHEARTLAAHAISAALNNGQLDHWGDECLVYGAPGEYSERIVLSALSELATGEHHVVYVEGNGILIRSPRIAVEQWAETRIPRDGTRGLVVVYDDAEETVLLTSAWLPSRVELPS